jgi:CheY-like chemotaxis protein
MDHHSILVVDDDDDVRKMLCVILEAEGYPAAEAANGAEALRLMRAEGPPAMVLVDLMMPRMDGEELIRKMSQDPALAHTPVAVVSGHSTPSTLAVNAQLVKPVELGELLDVVQRLSHVPTT